MGNGDVLASVKFKKDFRIFKKDDVVKAKLIKLNDDQYAIIFNGRRFDLNINDIEIMRGVLIMIGIIFVALVIAFAKFFASVVSGDNAMGFGLFCYWMVIFGILGAGASGDGETLVISIILVGMFVLGVKLYKNNLKKKDEEIEEKLAEIGREKIWFDTNHYLRNGIGFEFIHNTRDGYESFLERLVDADAWDLALAALYANYRCDYHLLNSVFLDDEEIRAEVIPYGDNRSKDLVKIMDILINKRWNKGREVITDEQRRLMLEEMSEYYSKMLKNQWGYYRSVYQKYEKMGHIVLNHYGIQFDVKDNYTYRY